MSDHERWHPPQDSTAAAERLRADLKANPEDTEEAIANRYLQKMYPAAVLELGRLAWYAESARERLSASKAIIAANLQIRALERRDANSPIEDFMKNVTIQYPVTLSSWPGRVDCLRLVG